VSISVVKCSEVLQCSGVFCVTYMVVHGCMFLYAFVYFCRLYILIVMFMYSYCFACSLLYPDRFFPAFP
jgi:hypothetical protein